MRENFLYYIWRYKKFRSEKIRTTDGQPIRITDYGQVNTNAGPDILNARLTIGSISWAGNVEFHTKASHWYHHGHHKDPVYDSVILHVVWTFDTEVYNCHGTLVPTLELNPLVTSQVFSQYEYFFMRPLKWINCETQISSLNDHVISNWFQKLFFLRLQRKSSEILSMHRQLDQDWEATTFACLAKYLAGPVNAAAFFSMAKSFDFRIVLKLKPDLLSLEALFFGQAGLLNIKEKDSYSELLAHRYKFLKRKYNLDNRNIIRIRFLRLRPDGFPTIRLSQLAGIYHKNSHIFSEITESERAEEMIQLFKVTASSYWSDHYKFGKPSVEKIKSISREKQTSLVLNVAIPLRNAYRDFLGRGKNLTDFGVAAELSSESNAIVSGFSSIGIKVKNAAESQAAVELKSNYCDKNKCMQCEIGNEILS